MKVLYSVISAMALLAGLTATAEAQPGTMKEIVPGVWYHWGDPSKGNPNSQIVIEMTDYLIVVDPNLPGNALQFISDVKKISSKPIRYVIDTHSDEDHYYGNVIYSRLGAITIGHIGLLREMDIYEPETWQRNAKRRRDVAELNLPGPELPILIYTKSPYVISDSSRRVELYNFGWGHTRGDTYVYLPKEKVLCTGDAVPSGPHSDPKKAWIANWSKQVAAAQKLDVTYVLPAHGAPGGRELLEAERRFLEELYAAVGEAIREGKTLEQLVTYKDGRPIDTSIRLSKSVMEASVLHSELNERGGYKGVIPGRFANQVVCTYEEITQGRPWGEIAAEEILSRRAKSAN